MSGHLSAQEAVRIELIRNVVRGEGALERAFAHALRLSSGTVGVRRVGIWFAEDGWRRLRARMIFDAKTDRLASGDSIDLATCPAYAHALRSRRAIDASDALADPRTSELRDYLEREGITSLLDSPIFQQGELVGVVCHENVGPKRDWTPADTNFVATVSDMIGLYLEQEAANRASEELLRTRAALEQTRVMESLGRMAAGVAHDFNNVLTTIGLRLELLARKSPENSIGAATARDSMLLVDQGAKLVRELLSFAREGLRSEEVVDLAVVVREMKPALEALGGGEMRIDIATPPSSISVRMTRSRAEQMVTNLAVNAHDSMIGGGTLRIDVGRDPASPQAVLRISDTGVGMDASVRARIFEPFFTTKPAGTRAGLGLATVYGIVIESGGRIEVASEAGSGSEFVIRLPLA